MGRDTIRCWPVGILVAIAVILLAAIIWIGSWVIEKPARTPPRPALTDIEKQEIFESLRLPPGTPPTTEAEKIKIMRSLK